jgi:Cu/Ag efflux protein CusF
MKKFVAIAAVSALAFVSGAYAQGGARNTNDAMPMMSGDGHQRMGNMGMMGGAAATQSHAGTGKVLSIKSGDAGSRPSITLAHGPISSLQWPSMTMTFGLDSPELLDGLQKDDTVMFRFVKGQGGWVITHLEKAGR